MRCLIHVEPSGATAFLTDDSPASASGAPVVVLRLRRSGPDYPIDAGLPTRWAAGIVGAWASQPERTAAELALAHAFIGGCRHDPAAPGAPSEV